MTFEECTLRQFMKCLFEKDFSDITEDEFSDIYTKYAETAKIYDADKFSQLAYVQYLSARINFIGYFIDSQLSYLDLFEVPYLPKLKELIPYGYNLKWNNSFDDFVKQCESIKKKEKRYENKLDEAIEKLNKDNDKRTEEKDPRKTFIKLMVQLSKVGYNIDKDRTTIEEFSIMIASQQEENQRMLQQINNR